MKRTNTVYLQDIFDAIEQIETYVRDLDFSTFGENMMCQDAVIRRFEIIGEASGRLTESFRELHPDFPFQESKRMRNILIHEYHDVKLKVIWKTIQEDLPKLREQVLQLLNEVK